MGYRYINNLNVPNNLINIPGGQTCLDAVGFKGSYDLSVINLRERDTISTVRLRYTLSASEYILVSKSGSVRRLLLMY